MAGPTFRATGARSQSASAATLSPAKPTVDGGNGILLCVVTSKNNATHATATGGWSLVGTQQNSGASFTASLWIAAESAAAPTFTWTGAVACSAQMGYCSDPQNTTNIGITASSVNTGLATTHSTTGYNTDTANTLALYIDVAAANTALATPAGWTEELDAGSATDAGRTVWGWKAVATTATATGAISVAGANAAWVEWQIEIKGSTPTSGLQTSKAQAGAFLDPATGLATAKAGVGAWLDLSDFRTAKMAVGAWLDPALSRRRPLFLP